MRVEIYPTVDGQWAWRIRGHNHEILASSERYTRKWSAKVTATMIAKGLNATVREVDI